MGLGQRGARRHDTAGVQREAGVNPELWWDFKPNQHVMTIDGIAGVVTAVLDGPHPGSEAYEVTLDNGLGGGQYTASQLREADRTVASVDHTAADDYPELGTILHDRPDPALQFSASKGGGNPFVFKHEETDTGGTKFPRRVDTTAHHPDTGEEAGHVRYFPPKRRGGPISIDEVKGHAPGAASAMLNEIEDRHPGSSTKFLHEVKRNNNNPDKTGHAHERAGQPTDWDTHYPNLAGTVHRGLSLRLPSYSARTVNSSANTKDEHLAELHSAITQGSAGTHWTENEHAARLFAHNAVSDHRTDIPVVLHASTPERKDLETRHDHLYRGGVFPYGDEHSSENEVPVRKGRKVAITGISWRPDAAHPDADEDGWMHHTYPEPVHHTAARAVPNAERAEADAEDHDEEDPEVIDSSLGGGDTPSSCSYCGSTQFGDLTDNGRSAQATCATCGGTMSSWGGQWTPELIGDPSNHPRMWADPASGSNSSNGAAADSLIRDQSRLGSAAWDDDGDDDEVPEDGYSDSHEHECDHCGFSKRHPDHGEVHDDWRREQKWHTDWDEVDHIGGEHNELHRGMAMSLPDHIHDIVHDESRPEHERAKALADHVLQQDQGHLGRFWSDEKGVSRNYATSTNVHSSDVHHSRDLKTPVVVHAEVPSRHHIETDPDELEHHSIYSYHLPNNREVPLQHGTPMHLKGVSWMKPVQGHESFASPMPNHWGEHPDKGSDDHLWHRHDFDGGIKATSSKVASNTLTWDEIGDRHPHVYGDSEIHGDAADGADGPGIGDAANYLAHERPGHPDAEDSSVHDLDFHEQMVHPRHIDYSPSGSDDYRVSHARQGYRDHPDEMPPLVLVKRHNVYQVADGHHRAEAAHGLDMPVKAYVAHSPHPDEPFRDGDKAPFHGAKPIDTSNDGRGHWERHLADEHDEMVGSEVDKASSYTKSRHDRLYPGCGFQKQSSVDWCAHRREARCWYPGDKTIIAMPIPQDRGPCPWTDRWQQQVCPISEPGPMALMQAKGALAAAPCESCKGTGKMHWWDVDPDSTETDESGEGVSKLFTSDCDDCDGKGHHEAMSDEEEEARRMDTARRKQQMHFDHETRVPHPDGIQTDQCHSKWCSYPTADEKADFDEARERSRKLFEEHQRAKNARLASDDADHRLMHQAPDADYGAPAHDLTGNEMFPEDVYTHPQHYNTGHEDYYNVHSTLSRARGNPEKKIRIYRSLPGAHADKGFKPGDWVTTSKAYARDHGRQYGKSSKHDWPVISASVPAKHLHTEGDLMEFAYNGEHTPGSVAFKGGHHEEVSQRADGSIAPVKRRAAPFKERENALKEKGYSFSHYPPRGSDGAHAVTAFDSDDNYAGHLRVEENGDRTLNIEPEHEHAPIAEHMQSMIDRYNENKSKHQGSLDSADLIRLARKDADLRFHFIASWADVREKAKRIRAEGGVRIAVASNDGIAGEVKGDHNVYETALTFIPASRKIGTWNCGCRWSAFAWGRSPAYQRFEGRMCSHALAMQFEAQSRGMFGRVIGEDVARPSWMKQRTPVVVQNDRDTNKNRTRRAVPPGNMRTTFEGFRARVQAAAGNVDPLDVQRNLDKIRDDEYEQHQDDGKYAENYEPLKKSDLHPDEHSAWRFKHNSDQDFMTGLGIGKASAPHEGPVALTHYRSPVAMEPLHLDEHGNSYRRHYEWEHPEDAVPKFRGWSGPHSASETLAQHPTWSQSFDDEGNRQHHMRTHREREQKAGILPGESHDEIVMRRNKALSEGGWNVVSSRPVTSLARELLAGDEDPADVMKILMAFGLQHSGAKLVLDTALGRVAEKTHMCPKCGHEVNEEARTCPQCGAELTPDDPEMHLGSLQVEAEEKRCPHCGGFIGPQAFHEGHCNHCGHPLAGGKHAAKPSEPLYLRFGHWPDDERSHNNVTGYKEEGVSVYDLDHHGEPQDPDANLSRWHEHDQHCEPDCDLDRDNDDYGNDTRDEMNGRVHRAERNRYNGTDRHSETGHLVKGEMVGIGHDGEPLLRKVKRVGDWIDHKHLFFPGAEPHRLARGEYDDDYEPPKLQHHAAETKHKKKHNRTQDTRKHAPQFGYGVPGWGLPLIWCSQCQGGGCGHCGGGGQVVPAPPSSPSTTVDPIPDESVDAGPVSTGGITETSSLHLKNISGSVGKQEVPTVAGVFLKAQDTGRILMLQRGLDDEKDPARGTWEAPGGHIEPDDVTSLHAAIREFEEEVGQPFPEGGVVHHSWSSPNGIYRGHLVLIPSEKDLSMKDGRVIPNPDDPKGDGHEQAAWWEIDHARKNPALREELKTGTPWKEIAKAGVEKTAKTARLGDEVEYREGKTWKGNANVTAHLPNGERIGELGWHPEKKHVTWVAVYDDEHRRQGVASGMLAKARQIDPDVHHNDLNDPDAFTESGRAWAEKTAAAWDSLSGMDPQPSRGVEEPAHSNSQNPASTGFATSQDPASWDELGELSSSSLSPVNSYDAMLHDEPEGALPSTDGAAEEDDPSLYEVPDTDSEISAVDGSATPNQITGSTADIVARFQATAAASALMSGGSAAGESGGDVSFDIAAAARAHLAAKGNVGLQKAALKEFNFAEQQELINEGRAAGTRARNFGDLQIEGTHYQHLEAALRVDETDSEDLFA